MFSKRTIRNLYIVLIVSIIPVSIAAKPISELSDAQLTEFGQQIEISLNSKNPYYFNLVFDIDRLLDQVFDEFGHSPNEDFHQGFVAGVKENLDLGSVLVGGIELGGRIQFLNTHRQIGTSSMIFRIIGNEGIDYHEYAVEQIGHNLRIIDGYIYSTGQRLSETIGELYITSGITFLTDYNDQLAHIDELHKEGKYRRAYAKWKNLSYEAKIRKSNLHTGLTITEQIGEKEYLQVYQLFSLYYPEEPAKHLMPLEGLLRFGIHGKAMEHIDRLDSCLQTDPMLNFVRAGIYFETEQSDKAEACLQTLIETMPDYEPGYISLLDLYLENEEFGSATHLLNTMLYRFRNYKEDYLPFFANYPEFMESAEYHEWLNN